MTRGCSFDAAVATPRLVDLAAGFDKERMLYDVCHPNEVRRRPLVPIVLVNSNSQ
jgi:hypothetical protein